MPMTLITAKQHIQAAANGDLAALQKILEASATGDLAPHVAGTAIAASAAELNKLVGAGAVVASGTTAAKIVDPAGGGTVDAEARTAINLIIDALEAFKVSALA